MKLSGILGTGSGKLGSSVFSVSGGEQIVRQYQPQVSNPSTAAQVEQRSKLKLLSQLGAALQPAIAIRKQGLVSARNRFSSVNFQFTYSDNNIANIELGDIQLTDANFPLAGFSVTRTGSNIHFELEESQSETIDEIMVVVLRRTSTESLAVAKQILVTEAGADGLFPTDFESPEGDVVILAYGMRFGDADAKAKYNNMVVGSASRLAQLISSNIVPQNAVGLTETRGLVLLEGESSAVTSGVFTASIGVVIYNNGTDAADNAAGSVSGAGRYETGETVTLVATPAEGYRFIGWRNSASGSNISTQTTYTFVANNSQTIYAVFAETATRRVILGAATGSYGTNLTTTGAGEYNAGDNVTVTATVPNGQDFDGWYSDQAATNKVSDNSTYQFTMGSANVNLYYKTTYDGGVL